MCFLTLPLTFFPLLLNPTFPFPLYSHSPLLVALLLFICTYTFQTRPSSFSSQSIASPNSCSVLPAHFCDYFEFLSTPKLSSHPLAHSGHHVLFTSCCPIAPFRIRQCVCPSLNYSIWTASLSSVLPGHCQK